MYLKCYAGDTTEFLINAAYPVISLTEAGNFDFIFTAKESLSDPDSAALIQRTEAHGITLIEANNAITGSANGNLGFFNLKLVHADSNQLQGKTLFCDIQGYKASTGEVRRFAYFRLRIDPAVTRETTPSITVNS